MQSSPFRTSSSQAGFFRIAGASSCSAGGFLDVSVKEPHCWAAQAFVPLGGFPHKTPVVQSPHFDLFFSRPQGSQELITWHLLTQMISLIQNGGSTNLGQLEPGYGPKMFVFASNCQASTLGLPDFSHLRPHRITSSE